LGDRVEWLGVLPHSELRAHFENSDVIIASSRHESAGQTLLEGAIAGVPMVGTNVGYLADFAPDAAVAVPIADAGALADATLSLLNDEDRRLRIAHEAQTRALAIDVNFTAAWFNQVYMELSRQ
jgi:glycosyltransferase involved in cell wall biosynthesis